MPPVAQHAVSIDGLEHILGAALRLPDAEHATGCIGTSAIRTRLAALFKTPKAAKGVHGTRQALLHTTGDRGGSTRAHGTVEAEINTGETELRNCALRCTKLCFGAHGTLVGACGTHRRLHAVRTSRAVHGIPTRAEGILGAGLAATAKEGETHAWWTFAALHGAETGPRVFWARRTSSGRASVGERAWRAGTAEIGMLEGLGFVGRPWWTGLTEVGCFHFSVVGWWALLAHAACSPLPSWTESLALGGARG